MMRNPPVSNIGLFVLFALISFSNKSFSADPVGNACPPEGCSIQIMSVEKSESELVLNWNANFLPDVSRNHIHVYWDNFKAEQVSSDAEANGFDQGDWVPTSAYPSYPTEGAMSLSSRGESTTICVTAANRDHAVLDPKAVHCMDISDSI